MGTPQELGIGLQVSDVSGQLSQMNLPQNDVGGRPLTYHARLEREGRHLHASERVGDAVQAGDKVVLQPNIDAGK